MFSVILGSCLMALIVDGSVINTTGGPVINKTGGPVRGFLVNDVNVTYYAYQGIPYAENPTGPLRFMPPVPKKSWTEVLNASELGPACPQPDGLLKRHQMDEDCLSINVFVPADRQQNQLLPVYINLHGGSFLSNSNNVSLVNGPQFFVKSGIIYVNMNCRLGSLGYLSLNLEGASGNAGLKDLLLGLKWVKENIRNFGGSENVTLGGQSSGSAMTHYMLLTEKSEGLFQRVILNSGGITNFRFLSRYPKEHALALAKQLGLNTDDDDEAILQNLKSANAFDIVDAQENLYLNNRNIFRTFNPFVPSVEKEFPHSLFTRNPYEILNEGLVQNVPILAGLSSREGVYAWPDLNTKSTKTLQALFPGCIPPDIEYPFESDMYKDLVNSITNVYFGDTNLTNWTLTNMYDLISDTQFTQSIGNWIKDYKKKLNSEKLYYYLFNFDGELNWAKINFNISFPGAAHVDDIGYLFVNEATKPKLNNLSLKSQQTLDNTVELVTSFVKYGNPNQGEHNIEWPEYGTGSHLVINDNPISVLNGIPFTQRFDFWKNVYNQYYEYVKNGGEVRGIPSEAV